MRLTLTLLPAILILAAVLGCSDDEGAGDPAQNDLARTVFSDAVTEFKVHVFYEAGAEPYTGNLGLSGNDTWDITRESYRALFAQHTGRTVSVPSAIGDMTAIDDQDRASWTAEQLIGLGDSLAPSLADGTRVNVTLVFLNGKFGGSDTILGVHFSASRFAFVFKDVVQSVGGTATAQRYVEQGTVVHELGHVVGFVDNGVPMVTDHQDAEHPHHTTNEDCVMYWAVESSEEILGLLTDLIAGNRLNLFGTEVLQDAEAYHP